jgi:hypothetical protein
VRVEKECAAVRTFICSTPTTLPQQLQLSKQETSQIDQLKLGAVQQTSDEPITVVARIQDGSACVATTTAAGATCTLVAAPLCGVGKHVTGAGAAAWERSSIAADETAALPSLLPVDGVLEPASGGAVGGGHQQSEFHLSLHTPVQQRQLEIRHRHHQTTVGASNTQSRGIVLPRVGERDGADSCGSGRAGVSSNRCQACPDEPKCLCTSAGCECCLAGKVRRQPLSLSKRRSVLQSNVRTLLLFPTLAHSLS